MVWCGVVCVCCRVCVVLRVSHVVRRAVCRVLCAACAVRRVCLVQFSALRGCSVLWTGRYGEAEVRIAASVAMRWRANACAFKHHGWG